MPLDERRLRRVARGLRRRDASADAAAAGPSPALRDRVLAALPPEPSGVVTKKAAAPMMTRSAFIAAAATAAVAAVVGPRLLVRPALAAQVSAAVSRANTWHLTGWRVKDGKKVRWEVWGRRAPFFYREQIGDEVLIDDGRTRTHVLPAKPADARGGGLPGAVLIRRSPGDLRAVSLSDPRAGFLVGLGAENKNLRPVSDAAPRLVLEGVSEMYTRRFTTREVTRLEVDRDSRLPVRYTVTHQVSHPGDAAPAQASPAAELTPAYDVPLPTTITRVERPEGYAVADLTRPAGAPEARGVGTATRDGVTMKGQAVGRDVDGNILLRFKGWIGDVPQESHLIPLGFDVDRRGGKLMARDDAGNLYVQVADSGNFSADTPEVWLAPVEPLRSGTPRPTRLTVHLPVGLSGYERIGDSGRMVPVLPSKVMTFAIPLPTADTPLDYEAESRWYNFHGRRPSFAQQIAEARGWYYGQRDSEVRDIQKIDPAMAEAARTGDADAPRWFEEAAREAERTGDRAEARRLRLNAEAFGAAARR